MTVVGDNIFVCLTIDTYASAIVNIIGVGSTLKYRYNSVILTFSKTSYDEIDYTDGHVCRSFACPALPCDITSQRG